jgi:hypothetical protein
MSPLARPGLEKSPLCTKALHRLLWMLISLATVWGRLHKSRASSGGRAKSFVSPGRAEAELIREP